MTQHLPGPLSLLKATCRRAASAALYELSGNISAQSEPTSGGTSFAQVHHDDIVRLPGSILGALALPHGGWVVLVPRPHTGIVELMSHDTYVDLYQPDLAAGPHRRRKRLQPILSALAEGLTVMAGRSGSWWRKP